MSAQTAARPDPDADPREAARLLALGPAQRWSAILSKQPGCCAPCAAQKTAERLALVAGFSPEQREAVTAIVE